MIAAVDFLWARAQTVFSCFYHDRPKYVIGLWDCSMIAAEYISLGRFKPNFIFLIGQAF
jgi:hypothetical protein